MAKERGEREKASWKYSKRRSCQCFLIFIFHDAFLLAFGTEFVEPAGFVFAFSISYSSCFGVCCLS